MMPLMVSLRRPSLTVAHGVQFFLDRFFHVVEIFGVEGQVNNFRSKYLSYSWIFCLFVRYLTFFRFGRRECKLHRNFFLMGFLLFYYQLYSCYTTVVLSTRDSTLTRVMSHGMKYTMFNTLLIILI